MKHRVLAINGDWARKGANKRYGAVGWYRLINPLEKLGCIVKKSRFIIGGAERALEMKKLADIWFVKPSYFETTVILVTDKNFAGAKLVLDLDDHPFVTDPKHPAYEHFQSKIEDLKFIIENSDHIVVSTEPLKQVVKPYNDKITVIPNAIDPKIWNVKNAKHKDGKIRIGWVGSHSHVADIEVVENAIPFILKKYPNVEFHNAGIGAVNDPLKREFYHMGTKGYKDFPSWLAGLGLDIGIAPLKDTEFNRCKSNIKWLEHAMLEIPMVLSDVYPYTYSVEHGKTGYLAKTTGQWIKYLSWLIESEEKRREIGKMAKETVLKDWTIDKQLPKYEKLFEELRPKDITVYTSLIGGIDDLVEKQNTAGAQFWAYSDHKSDTWEIKEPYDKFKDDRRNSRIQKIMPHLFIDTPYSVYLDANIELKVPAQQLIDTFLKDKDIAIFRHSGRDDVYQEADAVILMEKETLKEANNQVRDYAKRGIKNHSGLAECGMIIRRHTPEVNAMNEKWWIEYCRYSSRDQLSFPVAFDMSKVNLIEGAVWRHPWFKYNDHKVLNKHIAESLKK
jgi:glycosyltransferase involved in cell wall biosynthesis